MVLFGGGEGANGFFSLFFLEPMRWTCVRECGCVEEGGRTGGGCV